MPEQTIRATQKPQRRDPAATRKKLLTAARREFAQNGLAGARVDEIAARAGVNKQLVYHYFGDKDALYLAVLEWVYEEIRAQERKLNLEGLPPERAIKQADREFVRPPRRASRLHRAAQRRKPRRRPPCARFPKARGDAFAAGQHGLQDPGRRRARRAFSARASIRCISTSRSPASAISSFPIRRRCRRSSARTCQQPGRAARPPQARGRSRDAVAAAVRPGLPSLRDAATAIHRVS